YHKGLNEHKLISAPEIDILNNKVSLQSQKWSEKWAAIESKRRAIVGKEANVEEAKSQTDDSMKCLRQIDNLLVHTLSINDAVDWDSLKKKETFEEKPPVKPVTMSKQGYPPRPDKQSAEYTPVFGFYELLFKSKKDRIIQDAENKYAAAITAWESEKRTIDAANNKLSQNFEDEMKKWEIDVAAWEERRNNFLREQADFNQKIDQMKEAYLSKNQDSIIEYCEMVLNNSAYPESFPKNFELEYNPDNKILIVEYELPSVDCFPKAKEVKYVASRNELKEIYIPESQFNKMFDDTMYKITLRTIHELFEADIANAIEAISFNGWVRESIPFLVETSTAHLAMLP
ncbi:MAG: restriction endonuclease, partial [Actinomycetota bacterium]|nr:restriction endonuclease [Actinomycetota bacterium]